MAQLYALIDPRSPRYAGWCRDLGRDFIPVLSAEPVRHLLEGDEETVPVYFVDLGALSGEQLGAIVGRTAADYRVSPEEVLAEYSGYGLPIVAEGVIVCEDPNEGRLRFPSWPGAAETSPVA